MASTPPLPPPPPPPPPSGAMSSFIAGRTRWILLGVALLISVWLWRQSFQPAQEVPFAFIPAKLYEPDAVACTDNVADEPRPVSLSVSSPRLLTLTDLSLAIQRRHSSPLSKTPSKAYPPISMIPTLNTMVVRGGKSGVGSKSHASVREVWM